MTNDLLQNTNMNEKKLKGNTDAISLTNSKNCYC